jgi:O-acetyl-ADP-ribose deacetylase (regulator of RNase III)
MRAKQMDQQQRLDHLVEGFKKEAPEYRRVRIPDDTEGKRRLLRSLMNVRMPKPASPELLSVQDTYLRGRALEKGIVNISEIPTIRESLGSGHVFADSISVWQGDITRLAADAIVNAANSQMLGCFIPMHTCIDNCIHTYAGIQLREDCARRMNSLRLRFGDDYEQPTAVPLLTDAYNLPAKKVIHIVGPVVQSELTPALEKDLADCYRNTLDMCRENGLGSVAFCCISTGVFHFPEKRAAEIAAETVTDWLREDPGSMERVIFNVFRDEDRRYYEELF